MTWLNSLFITIKFTYNCNFEDRSVEFLDTFVKIDNHGKVSTDLYKKKMSINKYLLPTSFHPKHITMNIPYNVGVRYEEYVAMKKFFRRDCLN